MLMAIWVSIHVDCLQKYVRYLIKVLLSYRTAIWWCDELCIVMTFQTEVKDVSNHIKWKMFKSIGYHIF